MWTPKSESSAKADGGSVGSSGDEAVGDGLEDEVPVTSRFPKVSSAEAWSRPSSSGRDSSRSPSSSQQRVGLPQMNSNMMKLLTPPRPHTIQQYQTPAETEPLPTVWEERFPFGDETAGGFLPRSRSYYEPARPQQGQDYQESNHDGYHAQRNAGNQQRQVKARTYQGNSFNPSYGRLFPQAEQCPGLPLQIYRRLTDEISGMVITDYFGTGVTVARLHNDNIMEFGMCHVIFAMNSTTEQFWLKAFTKKTRTQEGNVLKFSRLLTANISLEFCGKTAILIGAPNGSLYTMAEKHMFNFFEENEASKFIEALDKGKNHPWNHGELRLQSQMDQTVVRQSQMRQEMTFESSSRPPAGSRNRDTNSRPDSRNQETNAGRRPARKAAASRPTTTLTLTINQRAVRPNTAASMTFEQEYYYGESHRELNPHGGYFGTYPAESNYFSNVRFRAPRVQLLVKVRTAYTLLGVGEISILKTGGGYDNLVFVGPRGQVICDHLIYSWNEPKAFQQNSTWECTWAAAANLLITVNPRQMPTIREFKLVANQKVVVQFIAALRQSASRALANRATPPGPNEESSDQRATMTNPESTSMGNQRESESEQQ